MLGRVVWNVLVLEVDVAISVTWSFVMFMKFAKAPGVFLLVATGRTAVPEKRTVTNSAAIPPQRTHHLVCGLILMGAVVVKGGARKLAFRTFLLEKILCTWVDRGWKSWLFFLKLLSFEI